MATKKKPNPKRPVGIAPAYATKTKRMYPCGGAMKSGKKS